MARGGDREGMRGETPGQIRFGPNWRAAALVPVQLGHIIAAEIAPPFGTRILLCWPDTRSPALPLSCLFRPLPVVRTELRPFYTAQQDYCNICRHSRLWIAPSLAAEVKLAGPKVLRRLASPSIPWVAALLPRKPARRSSGVLVPLGAADSFLKRKFPEWRTDTHANTHQG